MTTTTDVYAAYRRVLAEEAKWSPYEWTFKRHPDYTPILEHVTAAQGEQYIEVMQEQFPTLWKQRRRVFGDIALANDSLGKPEQHRFSAFDEPCSPTNLRYMWQALSIVRHIHDLYIPPVDIVEIGGGYGGLALYLRWAFPERIRSYTIVDVPEAGAIQAAFARELGFQINVVDGSVVQHELLPEHAYLVSAYGFSEFPTALRRYYEQTIIPHCDHGFLVWNMIPVYVFNTYPMPDRAHTYPHVGMLTIVDEHPLTGPGNKVVTF